MSNEQENPLENQPAQPNDNLSQPLNSGTSTPPPFQQLPPIGQFGGQGQQNLPNSTIALVLGIISIPGCCCYGILGLILGIIAWVLGGGDVKKYKLNPNQYSLSSYKNANAGRICGLIGAILGLLYLILIIAFIAFFGFAALKDPELMKEMLKSKGLQ